MQSQKNMYVWYVWKQRQQTQQWTRQKTANNITCTKTHIPSYMDIHCEFVCCRFVFVCFGVVCCRQYRCVLGMLHFILFRFVVFCLSELCCSWTHSLTSCSFLWYMLFIRTYVMLFSVLFVRSVSCAFGMHLYHSLISVSSFSGPSWLSIALHFLFQYM